MSLLRQMEDDSFREIHSGSGLGPLAPQLVRLYGEWWKALWRAHVHYYPSPATTEQLLAESQTNEAMMHVVWNLTQFSRLRSAHIQSFHDP